MRSEGPLSSRNPGLRILAILVWLGCFLFTTIWNSNGIQTVIAQDIQEQGKWYVVTRAFMLKQAVEDIRKRLPETGHTPELLIRKENASLYAFDDKRTFQLHLRAEMARLEWKKRGIKAVIMPNGSGFKVSLGRYLIAGYARQFEKRLELTGMPFSLQMKETKIPVYRFSFQFSSRQEAEKHWQAIKEIGATDPTLMDEKRMRLMFKN